MILAGTGTFALAGVTVQGLPSVASTMRTLTITGVVVQILWAGTRCRWTHTPAILRVNNPFSITLDALGTLATTRENAVYLRRVTSVAFFKSLIPDVFRCSGGTYALT